jgi:hypothetical protein
VCVCVCVRALCIMHMSHTVLAAGALGLGQLGFTYLGVVRGREEREKQLTRVCGIRVKA